jgi:hypothetical protein
MGRVDTSQAIAATFLLVVLVEVEIETLRRTIEAVVEACACPRNWSIPPGPSRPMKASSAHASVAGFWSNPIRISPRPTTSFTKGDLWDISVWA